MKTRTITIWVVFFTLFAQAQSVKHQSEIIRSIAPSGDYKIVADLYNSHRGVINIPEVKLDKNQPNDHFEITLKKYPNHARESDRNATYSYFPDHIAFPVTYFASNYEGNQKLQDKVGYVIRNGSYTGDDRIVFLNDYLFMLQNWESKDNYEVRWVIKIPNSNPAMKTEEPEKKKKKKKGFMGRLKDKVKSGAMGGVSIEKLKTEVLQPYLDKATAQQETYYATWIKKAENAKTKKYLDDKRTMMNKAVKQYNDDIFNSPEYQRMLAYQKWIENSVNLTVKNNTGGTIWVGSSAEAFITSEVSAGSTSTQTCTTDVYYYLSGAKGATGYKISSGDSNCGSTVTVN